MKNARVVGRLREKNGFTLIELIITVTVIGILAGLAVPLARNSIQREKEFALRQTLRDIRTAIDKYKEFSDRQGGFALMRFLYARAWVGTERPSVLFDLATAWLLDKKVLLPGVTSVAYFFSIRIEGGIALSCRQTISRYI